MNIKNENGITLVALVITIVVMIILASIAISSSVGDNGLIKQTEDGVINASIREVEEALDIELLLKEKEEIRKGNLSNLTISILTGEDTPSDNSDDILHSKNGTVYIIDISKLDIKGDYGKGGSTLGTTTDVFRIDENTNEVSYVSADGTIYINNK